MLILEIEKLDLALAQKCMSRIELLQVISSSTLQRIRSGKAIGTKPSGKVAQALGTSVENLLKKEEQPNEL